MKIRFEEKAFVRQRLLEEMTKALQAGWMLNEWAKKHVDKWIKLKEGGKL